MRLLLGIDGGGTHTRAVLVTPRGRIAGSGEAGPSNHHNVGIDAAARALREAAEAAWRAAGGAFRPAEAAFLGIAGVKARVDSAAVTAAAESAGLAPPGRVTVANDLHNALAGGLAGRPGIALIAGTGTNCLGRDAAGGSFMCGGWGWLLDDRGGGFGLAVEAFRAAARSADGRARASRLVDASLAFLGLAEPNEMLARLYVRPWTPDELAGFAPTVLRLAAGGDVLARGVVRDGAAALAELVRGAARRLEFPGGPEVVLLGGCLREGEPYRDAVATAIRRACPGARVVPALRSPLEGAALNALRAAGLSPRLSR